MNFIDKDLRAVQEARVLMEQAAQAKKKLALYTQQQLDQAVDEMLQGIAPHLGTLVEQAVEETGIGCTQDERLMAQRLMERIKCTYKEMQCVGMLSAQPEQGMVEIGVPMGIIAAVLPAVSPVTAAVSAVLTAVKSGNAIVLTPHPRAVKTTAKTVAVLQESARKAGLAEGSIGCMETSAKEGALALLRHPEVSAVLNMGQESLLNFAEAHAKPVVYGGVAPGPAFIEKTADVAQAAADVVASRSFNYGTAAASEQYLVVDRQIADRAERALKQCGAYFMNQQEQDKLVHLLGIHGMHCGADKAYIGKSAQWLAVKAGFSVPEGTKVLVSRQDYITDFNPYASALLCPVLVMYIEDDWVHACEKCIELLMGESHSNTLSIHSSDSEVIGQFAMKKPVGRVLVNTPMAMGAVGCTTNLFPSLFLGGLTAKQGITADNISPKTFTYQRKAAFGVRAF